MGGTFDPIHYGHLFIAAEAMEVCGLEQVLFIPTGEPAHAEGKEATANAWERYGMVELAIADNPAFRALTLEIERPGKSYLYDTLCQLRREWDSAVQLHFIIGADSAFDLHTWYRSGELFELCQFVAVSRPGFPFEEARARLGAYHSLIHWIEAPGLHIASRELRERVRSGRGIRYLVPPQVEARIAQLNLYRGREAAAAARG